MKRLMLVVMLALVSSLGLTACDRWEPIPDPAIWNDF